jgi:glycosyltransferase involved in cell wall biosynthesis
VFECHYINLLASHNVSESGKISLRKLSGFTVTLAKILYLLVTNRPQLCYLALTVTGAAFYKDMLLVVMLKIFGIKRIYHLHNKGVNFFQKNAINRFCYRFVFEDANIILLSKHLYFDIQQFVPKEKIHICPNGIVDERQEAICRWQKAKRAVRILFLSNLIESKGVFVLLEACKILKNKNIPFECVFIGGEGNITALRFSKKVNQLDLQEEVFYQGEKYGDEKLQAFLETDIVSFPTYFETFGLVILEAMSHSLPIVSTFEGGIPDIVEDGVTGFLVPQKNVLALAEKLELLIKNPVLRQQMGKAGRLKYEQQFTLEIFEKRIVDIIQRTLSTNEKC